MRQPLRFQPAIQLPSPSIKYLLSVRSVRSGCSGNSAKRCKVASAACNSIRLLVVAGSAPPNSSTLPSSKRINAPHPPGPGLPLQAPSVAAATTRPRPSGPSAIDSTTGCSVQQVVVLQFGAPVYAANLPPAAPSDRNGSDVGGKFLCAAWVDPFVV